MASTTPPATPRHRNGSGRGRITTRLQEHVAEVDRLGYNSINFAEHHFDPDGYNNSMIVMMTMTAMKTKQALIGQNIMLFPNTTQYASPRISRLSTSCPVAA